MSRDFDFSNLNSCLSWNGLQKGRVALAFLGMAGLCCPGVQPRGDAFELGAAHVSKAVFPRLQGTS